MSDSTDNTNELDSYGVWVKKSPSENTDDNFDITDSLDLPDFEEQDSFEDTDFSDMFKDDNQFGADNAEGDTTLTSDELLNLTNGMEDVPVEEASVEFDDIPDDIPSEEVQIDDIPTEAIPDFPVEESNGFVADSEPAAEETEEVSLDEFEEVSFDDFGSDDAPAADSSDEGETEISLDDFMSDSPAPSAGGDEEVSLDDFVDLSEFGVESAPAAPKEEEIVDEKPLDMDISFDSSADTIQTEENTEAVDNIEDDEETALASESFEEVSFDDIETKASTGDNIETEEIDLSDFGIDSNAEETPVTQDVEGSKIKEQIVDYDLSVDNDNMSSAPIVNEIKSEAAPAPEQPVAESSGVAAAAGAVAIDAASSSLLQQIVADLSSLKEEINSLKTNLAEIKAKESTGIVEEPVEESFEADTTDDIFEGIEEPADQGGFFGSSDDDDDTLSLSTDDLNKIMNTSDFVTAPADFAETSDETIEAPVEESPIEEVTFDESPVEEAPVEEVVFDEEVPVEETVIEEAPVEEVSFDETPVEEVVTEEPVIEETFVEENSDELPESIDFEDFTETTEEAAPVEEETISEYFTEDISETPVDEDLPEEIAIPNEEEEEDNNDLLKAAAVTGAAVLGAAAIATAVSKDDEENEETIETEEPVEENFDDTFSDVDSFETEEIQTVEEVTEDTVADESFEDLFDTADEIIAEEEIPADETIIEEAAPVEDTFAEEVVPEEIIEEPILDDAAEDAIIENEEPLIEETFIEEPAAENLENGFVSEPLIQTEEAEDDFNFETVEEDTTEELPVEEEVEEIIEEPVAEEIFEPEEVPTVDAIEDDFASDELVAMKSDDSLSPDHIDYLTEKDEPVLDDDANAELKKDIKSVLLYMDQLLENLPEDKIIEFAKSDEFTTYKKLFSELGLS